MVDDSHDGILLTPLIRMSRLNPYPAFERLRAKGPVFFSPIPCVFLVSGLREANQVFKDARMGRESLLNSILDAQPRGQEALASYRATVLFTDPPAHGRMRAFMSRAFQPRVLEGLRADIEGIVDTLLGRLAKKKKADMVAALSQPMPVEVIAKLIGVPKADWKKCVAWSGALAPVIDAVLPHQVVTRAIDVGFEFGDYIRGLVERRKKKPEADILTALVRGTQEPDGLTEDELVSNMVTLFTAGHETTTNLISNTFVLLAQFPDQRALLEADPSAHLDGLVEESARYEPPVQLSARVAREATQIGDVPIPKGATIWVLIGACNRDPERFVDAQRFDITRSPNPHVSFGAGIHYCLGAALARLETRIALERFFARYPRWRLADEPLVLRPTSTLRGYLQVPVELRA